jgi:predicted nucleic acid-binding protein
LKVVSDASVLISLSCIYKVELLHERFPESVVIPSDVWKESVEEGSGRPEAQEVT